MDIASASYPGIFLTFWDGSHTYFSAFLGLLLISTVLVLLYGWIKDLGDHNLY